MKKVLATLLCMAMLLGMVPALTTNIGAASTHGTEEWLWPVEGCLKVGSNFGYRNDPSLKPDSRWHAAIDIGYGVAEDKGKTVRAAKSGEVVDSYNKNTYTGNAQKNDKVTPNYVKIKHEDGTYSYYVHMLAEGIPSKGTHVNQGDPIGKVGATGYAFGPHLHFAIGTGSNFSKQSTTLLNPMPTNSEITIRNPFYEKETREHGWPVQKTTYVFTTHTHSFVNCVCSCGAWDSSNPSSYHITKSYSDNTHPSYASPLRNGIVLKCGPYSSTSSGRSVSKSDSLRILAEGYNALGRNNTWYKVQDTDGKEYYVQQGDLGGLYCLTGYASIRLNTPSDGQHIIVGDACSVTGTVTSNLELTSVESIITSSSGTQISYKRVPISGRSYSITGGGVLDEGTKFRNIKSAGTYTLTVRATDISGQSYTATRTIYANASPSSSTQNSCKPPIITETARPGGKTVRITQQTPGATLTYYCGLLANYNLKTTENYVEFNVDQDTAISAYSTKGGTSAYYGGAPGTPYYVSVPTLNTPGIEISTAANGAKTAIITYSDSARVYYSLSGTNYQPYTDPILLLESGTVSAYAALDGYRNSETVSVLVELTAPNAPQPVLSTTDTKAAQGSGVSLRWDPSEGAQSYTVNIYKNGALADTRSDLTECGTTVFLDDIATYSFGVTATGRYGTSGETKTASITAVAPLTVRFLNYDDTLLSEQKVDYGTAATAPAAPDRTGYYFQRWDTSLERITQDVTVKPVYQIITYTVTYMDKDGGKISSEKVTYGGSANPPESQLTIPANYSFYGWNVKAESPESKCSLSEVDSNLTAQAVFVWSNQELPVAINSITAEWNSQKTYQITVKAENTNTQTTTAMLRVSLKGENDQFVKTDNKAIEMAPGEQTTYTFTLTYKDGTAARAEAVVLGYQEDGYKTGSTYSRLASCAITTTSGYAYTEWSDWSTTRPSESASREIESKQQYRYRTKLTTESSNSSLDAWTRYDSSVSYGAWSGTQQTTTAPTASDTLRIINSYSVYDYTVYTYYHYWGYGSKDGKLYNSPGTNNSWSGSPQYESFTRTSPLTSSGTSSYQGQGIPKYNLSVSGMHGNIWYLSGQQDYSHTVWEYQTRTAYTTYYYYKWSDWSDWQDAEVTADSNHQVDTPRTLYRYRDKTVPITSEIMPQGDGVTGIVQESGQLDTSTNLSGKYATVLIYKGKNTDPTESQLEYVGQTQITSGNHYSFSYHLREEPTDKTGDFVIAMSIQGATGLVNVKTLDAPKPIYTVRYLTEAGECISTQSVQEGANAAAPEAPEIDGYRFITWDNTGTNVHSDIDIYAKYVPNTYAVVFVDYVNQTAVPYAVEHGTDLSSLAENLGTPSAKGHTFNGWVLEDGTALAADTTATANAVIIADYETDTFDVVFHKESGEALQTQRVLYGSSASLPKAPTVDGMTFLGWSTDVMWWNVRENLDVYPIYVYNETTAKPESDVGSMCAGDEAVITLTAEADATIFYTTDGSEPDTESMVYSEPIYLMESATVRAMSCAPGKNNSEILDVYFDYVEPAPDNGCADDLVEVTCYDAAVNPKDDLKLQVSLSGGEALTEYLITVECDKSAFYLECDENDEYVCTPGSSSPGGVHCIPYGSSGWQILWYGNGSTANAGKLFDLTLKVSEEAEVGTYPIHISYSTANTRTSAGEASPQLSVSAAKADAPSVSGSFNSSGKLIATVTAPKDSILIAAYYDSQGKQLGIKTIAIDAACTGKTYDTGLTKKTGCTYKLMSVDKTTYAPRCAAWNGKG